MSQKPKHMKIKMAQRRVLLKRNHFMRTYPEIKSYKPLCKKLQNNNNSLAKALSKQKQESQLLFSRNVALIAEVQDLGLACNKRDVVISNVLKNSKEILKMIVTVTGFLTNTISSCQEFTNESAANTRLSYNSAGKKDSCRRLSAKSPTRGVVKPMVSGHTITKPTINLSRVNMQRINNPSNLSIIPEVATPPRIQELNTSRSPNAVTLRQRRADSGRACRMPERLTASQRESDESERRLSERRSVRHSGRMSGRLSISKSSRLSRNNTFRHSTDHFEHIGSPRVKLNDVSKLLQNSQSINIRMLNQNLSIQGTNRSENNVVVNQEDPETDIIAETSPSDDSNDNIEETMESSNGQSNNEMDTTDQEEKENLNDTKNHTPSWEDPLEGPSWLLNNSEDVPSFVTKSEKTDDINFSNADSLNTTEPNDTSENEKSAEQVSPQLSKRASGTNSCKDSKPIDENEYRMLDQSKNDSFNQNKGDTFCVASSTVAAPERNENQYKVAPPTVNLANFVTHRRGYFEGADDDDFTLIYARRPRNMHFDINDLKLPVLEQSTLRGVVPVEPEPEITTTLRKISQICPMPSVSHNTLEESAFNQSTVKLPLLLNNDYEDKDLTPVKKEKEPSQRNKKSRKATLKNSGDSVTETPPANRKNSQKRGKEKVMKDPSAVKVVLQKLNESDVKSRTPSPDVTISRVLNLSSSPLSSRAGNSSDSESNTSSNTSYTSNRPRRKRAPTSLHEPSLKKKLRRNV